MTKEVLDHRKFTKERRWHLVTCFLEPLPSAGLSVGSGVGGERGILRGVTWKRTLESSSQGGETDPTTTHYPRPDDRAFRETILRLFRLFLDTYSLQLGNSEVLCWTPTGESQRICGWPARGSIADLGHKLHFLWTMGSAQFSRSVVSNSLRPHGPQHARPPCLSTTPRVYSNSCPLSWWCHLTISSSVIPFFSCPQSLPASGSFPMSQVFTSGGQSIGVSASASVLPMNIQDWSPLGWTGWISFQSKGLSRVFSNTTVQKHQFCGAQLSL